MKIHVHLCIKQLSCDIHACVCACVGGCALAYVSVLPYFILRDVKRFCFVRVAVDLLGGMIISVHLE